MEDIFGNEIKPGEQYFIVKGQIVHADAAEDYLIEKLGAIVRTAKENPTAHRQEN